MSVSTVYVCKVRTWSVDIRTKVQRPSAVVSQLRAPEEKTGRGSQERVLEPVHDKKGMPRDLPSVVDDATRLWLLSEAARAFSVTSIATALYCPDAPFSVYSFAIL